MILDERKTEISWDAEEKIAKIWTNDPAMIKRLDVLCEHRSGAYQCTDKYGQSAIYKVPAKLIVFRFPTEEEMQKEIKEKYAARAHSKAQDSAGRRKR